jgi:resolvase-like protein
MNESLKVQLHHLQRSAYLYIRQSSMRQVMENVESTKRQYALRNRAAALGWRDDQIIVIDNDQGESGTSAVWREGFQRLVTDVGMGHAGMVMGLEVSRLARNNADWHRLLEICALADTLILDENGVYDPASFNDRLLLGLNPAKARGRRLAGLHSGGPSRIHQLGAIPGEPQNPRGKRPWLQCGACVAAARRRGFTPGARCLRAVRKALPRSVCRAAWKAGSLVCLRSRPHGSRRGELPVDCGRTH